MVIYSDMLIVAFVSSKATAVTSDVCDNVDVAMSGFSMIGHSLVTVDSL